MFARLADVPSERTETPSMEPIDVGDVSEPATTAPSNVEEAPLTESEEIIEASGIAIDVSPIPIPEQPSASTSPSRRRSTRHRAPPELYGFNLT